MWPWVLHCVRKELSNYPLPRLPLWQRESTHTEDHRGGRRDHFQNKGSQRHPEREGFIIICLDLIYREGSTKVFTFTRQMKWTLSIVINILDINEEESLVHLFFQIELTWFDFNLHYQFLNKFDDKNDIHDQLAANIWSPNIEFIHTKGGAQSGGKKSVSCEKGSGREELKSVMISWCTLPRFKFSIGHVLIPATLKASLRKRNPENLGGSSESWGVQPGAW